MNLNHSNPLIPTAIGRRTLLQRTGFALPVIDTETHIVRYDDLYALMRDLRNMGMANPLQARSRIPAGRSLFQRAAQVYAERYSDPDGRIRATFNIIYLSGWKPHEGQQKPLTPGSAKTRLADALGTRENKLLRNPSIERSGEPVRHVLEGV